MALRLSAINTTMFEDNIVIPSAQILTLFTTPVELIAAPGAGKYMVVEYIEAFNDFGTTAYATDVTGIDVKWAGGPTISNLSQAWAQATADQLATALGYTDQDSVPSNAAVQVQANVSDPTTGDGDWRFHIVYRILTLP